MSQSDTSPVLLAESQMKEAAELLARVFQHDPMMEYLVANPTRLLDKPARFYQASIRMGMLYGTVYTTSTMDGVAVWVSPGNTDLTFGQLLRSGFLIATLSMGVESMRRFMRSASYFERLKEQAISGSHWVLVFLGVEPSKQGQGIGGALIQPILAQADTEHVPIYLDSTNERNLTFYQSHGFKVVGHGQVPNGGPRLWAMRREPNTQTPRPSG